MIWASRLASNVEIVPAGRGNEKRQKCHPFTSFLAFRQALLSNWQMDSTDMQLLALLRQDARTTVATLATKLGVSRGTVTNRVKKLEDEGVITGYTVRLRPDSQPQEITAWMSITVDGNQTREVIAHLLGEPGVAGLHDTNGRWDLLAELRAANLVELAATLERVRLIKGIAGTETSIHLQTYKVA
jgi:DNA-binding Lrp family transcriptional regulator